MIRQFVILTLFTCLLTQSALYAADFAEAIRSISDTFDALAEEGIVVGGQVAVSQGEQPLLSHVSGVKAKGSVDQVDTDTLFLIASCSKPFASACVLRLMQEGAGAGEFTLDDEIDRWLPAYASASIAGGGKAERAPTIAELLCHRSGIYSQKVKITRAQARILYTFEHNLEFGVDEIARQPLIMAPGEGYAYSGAGYCVLGRVAELAVEGERSFELLLQDTVCQPLGLARTSYFPAGAFENIATGFDAGRAPHSLGDRHRWPLIGGSLYSSAEDMVRFAQGVGGFVETANGEAFLGEEAWQELEVVRNPGKGYSLGWSTLRRNGDLVRLSHSGSLQGYRSFIAVDRSSRRCVGATWTLPSPAEAKEAGSRIRKVLEAALDVAK